MVYLPNPSLITATTIHAPTLSCIIIIIIVITTDITSQVTPHTLSIPISNH